MLMFVIIFGLGVIFAGTACYLVAFTFKYGIFIIIAAILITLPYILSIIISSHDMGFLPLLDGVLIIACSVGTILGMITRPDEQTIFEVSAPIIWEELKA